jgi:hypothetical protein
MFNFSDLCDLCDLGVFAGDIPSFGRGSAALGSWRLNLYYGFIDSAKYFDGDQTFAVKLLQPRIRSSRMIRI